MGKSNEHSGLTDAQLAHAHAEESLRRAQEHGDKHVLVTCREMAREIAVEVMETGNFDPTKLEKLLTLMTWLPRGGEEAEQVLAMLPNGCSEQARTLWNENNLKEK